jgi:hypothetical protein
MFSKLLTCEKTIEGSHTGPPHFPGPCQCQGDHHEHDVHKACVHSY